MTMTNEIEKLGHELGEQWRFHRVNSAIGSDHTNIPELPSVLPKHWEELERVLGRPPSPLAAVRGWDRGPRCGQVRRRIGAS